MTADTHEKFARIRLLRSANIGPVSYFQLLARFGSARHALEALPDLARRGGARSARIAGEDAVRREIDAVKKAGAKYLFHDDAGYPELLSHSDSAPPILTYRGNTALLNKPSVAIVGARNASAAACKFARLIAHDLAAVDCVTVSGLARGIDTAAHMGAGKSSIGVIASGIDIAYPPENAVLQGPHGRGSAGAGRTATGHAAAGAAFPLSQPHHRRVGSGHTGRRGPHRVRARSSPQGWRARRGAR